MPAAAVSEPATESSPTGPGSRGGLLGRVARVPVTAVKATILFGMLGTFWLGTFVFSWTGLPALHVFVRDPIRRRRAMQRLVSFCFRFVHAVLGGLGIYRRRWRGQMVPQTPAVIVANHPSFLDFTAIAAACPTVCCVVKPLLMRNPFVGRVLRACGHVDGRSLTFAGAETTFRELRERLAEGFPVLIFPEGTRSPRDGLHAFRRGAFKLACDAGVPLHPLVIDCHPPALGKGVSIWEYPRSTPMLTIEVEPAVDTRGRFRRRHPRRLRETGAGAAGGDPGRPGRGHRRPRLTLAVLVKSHVG